MKYALHDTEISKIVCNNEGLELHFGKGVYLLNEKGTESELSKPCRLVITINGFDRTRTYEHITVTRTKKSKVTEMDFADFLKLLEKDSLRIDIDYYSFFGASILLKGYLNKCEIELTVTEIEKAEYIFDE